MAFIKKISDYITKNYDLKTENITIVFPNKRAALQLRNELAETITTNFWVPQILSIQQAMEEWSELQLIDNVDVIFEIIKINHEFFPYAAQMAKDFDEIDQYDVNAAWLFDHLEAEKEIKEWNLGTENSVESNYLKFFKSLITYYNNLRATLENNGQGYYGMITRKIASFDDETLQKCTQGRKIIFAGFNAMTKTEESIIVRMVRSGNAVILWDLDNYYYNDKKQEAGFFARNFFEKYPEIPKNFIGDDFKNQEKNINIISVSGNSVQSDALQLALSKDKKDKKEEKEKKGVIVLADETLLVPVLNSIPEEYGNIQVTMGYPFSKTIVYHFVEQLFRYQQTLTNDKNKYYLWTFIKLFSCEFNKLIFNDSAYNKTQSKLMKMGKELNYYFKKSDIKDFVDDKQLIDFLNLITKKWDGPQDCLDTITEILKLSIQKLDKDNYFVKNQVSVAGRIINRLELLLTKYSSIIQIVDLQALFIQVANQMSINYQRDTTEGLQIMGLLETRNLDFDVIHFLSVNEGILPKNKSNNSLIPFNLRKEYGMPTYTYQQNVYAYHFYRLLQSASEINLYYNNVADQSGMGEPSRFIRQLEYEYLRYNNKAKLEHWQYKSPSVINIQKDFSIDKTDEILDKIDTVSPTSIGNYLRCPLRFYFQHVERINDEMPEEAIGANDLGNVVHATLQYFYELFGNREITLKDFDETYKNHFAECYDKALKDNRFTNGWPENGFNYLGKTVVETMLHNFIAKERESLKKGAKLHIIALETKLEKNVDIQGHKVKLYGKADRIDNLNGEIRVIDYKTGKVDKNDVKIGEDDKAITSMKEKSIQLLMYKYLYLQNNKGISPDSVKPGIVGFKKLSNGMFGLKIDNDELNADFEGTCEKYFDDFLTELFDKGTPFKQCEDSSTCKSCDFKSICKRVPREFNS